MKLMLVDASFYFYKAFYGANHDPKGAMTKMMQAALDCHEPDTAIVALDAGKQTFRSEMFPGYKANRPPSPDGFSEAVASMKEAFTELGFQFVKAPGFEADDVLGTLCAINPDDERVILSRDKDLMQLVCDGVSMWIDGAWIREKEVIAKFGVRPGLVVDVMGLSGDSGDGIPGVPGIGAKIASNLIQSFGALEAVYANLDVIGASMRGGAKISATLSQSKEMAFLSRRLATIVTTVELHEVGAIENDSR